MRLSYTLRDKAMKMRSWVRAPGGPSILESRSTNVEDSSILVSFSNNLLFYPIECVNPCKELRTCQSYTFCLFTPSLKREKSKQIAILKKARLNYRYRS